MVMGWNKRIIKETNQGINKSASSNKIRKAWKKGKASSGA
jgi:hypothetical protein